LIYAPSANSKVYSFISKCIKLFDYIKQNKKDKIADVQEFVIERVDSIWDKNLEAIKQKRDDLIRIQKEPFWEEITFEDVDFLVREISPLMIFYEEERKNMLRINAPDVVINVQRELMEKKEDKDFINFVEKNPLIKKIKDGEGVTSKELLEIETKLKEFNPSFTIENIQHDKDFIMFLRDLIHIKGLPDPQDMIKWEFEKFVSDRNQHYNVEQLRFLGMLEKVFIRAKHIELKDLAEHPLADARPLDIFTKEQLQVIVQKCNKLKWK
jgi:type I restriction enzyme R subunit